MQLKSLFNPARVSSPTPANETLPVRTRAPSRPRPLVRSLSRRLYPPVAPRVAPTRLDRHTPEGRSERIPHGSALSAYAGGGGRTHTSRRTRDFESRASASSATPASTNDRNPETMRATSSSRPQAAGLPGIEFRHSGEHERS